VCPDRVVEAYGQSLWQDFLLDPVDERMKRGGRITNRSTAAMFKSRDVEVAEEIIHVSIEVHHATVVVVGSLVRDDGVGLDKKLAELYEKRHNSRRDSLYVGRV
jgi:hypothetical protein